MNDTIQALIDAGVLRTTPFAENSRYRDVQTAVVTGVDEQRVVYLRRRFIPQPEMYALIQEHVVEQGDRPDLLAFRYLNDPEQFWRVCDANVVFDTSELVATPGQRIRITLPAGLPGTDNA
jgi:hypothetical protein